MKRIRYLIPILFCTIQVSGQIDFSKLQQEYMSRKPALDTMRAYPDVPYTSLKVTNSEGIDISCWWIPREKNKGTILLVHGFDMNKSQMLPRAKVYYDLGYNVLLMDLRARGESGGTVTTSGPEIRSDVLAVMDYYDKNLNDYGQLFLAGYSHGGRAVVFAAEQKPTAIKAIILESIPYSLSAGFKRIYKVEPPPFSEGDIDKAFQSISSIPILLMIGNMDQAIIPEEAEKIKGLFGNSKSQLIVFNGMGHNLSTEKNKPAYTESIRTFLTSSKK